MTLLVFATKTTLEYKSSIANGHYYFIVSKQNSKQYSTTTRKCLNTYKKQFRKRTKIPNNQFISCRRETHIGLPTQTTGSIKNEFTEISMDIRRQKRCILNNAGSLFKTITRNLEAADFIESTNRLNQGNYKQKIP